MYVFKKRLANDNSTWECELHGNDECGAYIKHGNFENFVEQRNEHSHPPSHTKCNITKAKVSLKRKAIGTMDKRDRYCLQNWKMYLRRKPLDCHQLKV